MISTVVTVLAMLLIDKVPTISAHGWTYGDEAEWGGQCSLGRRQSPIALSMYRVTSIGNVSPFEFKDYNIGDVIIKNNGHTVEVRPVEGFPKPELRGGGLPKVYQFDHFHFHWQSEHTIDNIRYPFEIHFVHFAKDYGSLANAPRYPDGCAVLAVLGHLSNSDAWEFSQITNTVKELVNPGSSTQRLDELTISSFLPKDPWNYFRYEGSLTTPGCDEAVIWTVFENTVPISSKQISVFQSIHTEEQTTLVRNYRALQPQNGRPVLRSSYQARRSCGRPIGISRAALLVDFLLVVLISYVGFR